MGTRGLYGLRRDGTDKLTYCHFDSYPEHLGLEWLRFANRSLHSGRYDLDAFYDQIRLVGEKDMPEEKDIRFCTEHGFYSGIVSERSVTDWYCLLYRLQGNRSAYEKLAAEKCSFPMIDSRKFILDSLMCEYAYILNLDTRRFEYWVGFQKEPQEGNRYGTARLRDGEGCETAYYPCRLDWEISFDLIARLHECDMEDLAEAMAAEEERGKWRERGA